MKHTENCVFLAKFLKNMSVLDFSEIRPYNKQEVKKALHRIANAHELKSILEFLMPDIDYQIIKNQILESKTTAEFQKNFMDKILRAIIERYAEALTFEGFDKLSRDESCLFLGNHRDIILDSSILCILLLENGLETCENTWGNNLMVSPFIVDLGKVNRMITVFRKGSPRQLLKNSQVLSAYIREAIIRRTKSVWVAHHKGRAKDGNDKTDLSVLKMLLLSGDKNIIKNLKELNIRIVTVSYEWEPCDGRKIRELFHSQENTYVKNEDDDLESIIGGVLAEKGRIHMVISDMLNNVLDEIEPLPNINKMVAKIANRIDMQIYHDYKLWPANYLAYDILKNNTLFANKYTNNTKRLFEKRYRRSVDIVGIENEKIRKMFLLIYANPVINKLKNGFL